MATINFSSPVSVQLIDGTDLKVSNVQTTTRKDFNTVRSGSIPYVSVGFHEAYDRNAVCESGTITYQMVSDINGDASPPLVGISSTSIFDQDPLITFETYFDRPKNSQTSQRVGSSVSVPSINLSGAQFDAEVDFDVRSALAPSKPHQIDEKLIYDTKNNDLSLNCCLVVLGVVKRRRRLGF